MFTLSYFTCTNLVRSMAKPSAVQMVSPTHFTQGGHNTHTHIHTDARTSFSHTLVLTHLLQGGHKTRTHTCKDISLTPTLTLTPTPTPTPAPTPTPRHTRTSHTHTQTHTHTLPPTHLTQGGLHVSEGKLDVVQL